MGKGKKRRLRELDELLPAGKSLPTVPVEELPEHDLTFPHSTTMLRVDPEGTGGCSARCPRRVAVDRATLADAQLTPATRDAFTAPIRYAVARYGSTAAAAAWREGRPALPGQPVPERTGPAGGHARSHICTRPDACLDRAAAAPAPETAQQRATRLDRERDEAGKAYRAAIHAADEAWREIGGRQ